MDEIKKEFESGELEMLRESLKNMCILALVQEEDEGERDTFAFVTSRIDRLLRIVYIELPKEK